MIGKEECSVRFWKFIRDEWFQKESGNSSSSNEEKESSLEDDALSSFEVSNSHPEMDLSSTKERSMESSEEFSSKEEDLSQKEDSLNEKKEDFSLDSFDEELFEEEQSSFGNDCKMESSSVESDNPTQEFSSENGEAQESFQSQSPDREIEKIEEPSLSEKEGEESQSRLEDGGNDVSSSVDREASSLPESSFESLAESQRTDEDISSKSKMSRSQGLLEEDSSLENSNSRKEESSSFDIDEGTSEESDLGRELSPKDIDSSNETIPSSPEDSLDRLSQMEETSSEKEPSLDSSSKTPSSYSYEEKKDFPSDFSSPSNDKMTSSKDTFEKKESQASKLDEDGLSRGSEAFDDGEVLESECEHEGDSLSENEEELDENDLLETEDELERESFSDGDSEIPTSHEEEKSSIDETSDDLAETQEEASVENALSKKELLQRLRDRLVQIQEEKTRVQHLQKNHLSPSHSEMEKEEEEKYELSEQTNQFLNQLGELPSFEEREKGPGYSIDTNSYTEVPDSIIRTLITKFLNQRFCRRTTDLNVRSHSLEKTKGFYKWENKDVIIHLETNQVTKVLDDKYGYEYANGKNENVPLSFYFDMSGSMSNYTNMLAVIAIELLKKNVKVLIGFNERVNVQIESIEKNITVLELAKILESAGYYSTYDRDTYPKDPRVKFKYLERNLDSYLIEKKAEKCVVFSDFDPIRQVCYLSLFSQVYWFCFEPYYQMENVSDFCGFIYPVQNVSDLERGLVKVNEKRFETLCYTDNPDGLRQKVRVKK